MISTQITQDYLNQINKITDSKLNEIETFARQNHIPVMLTQTASFLSVQTNIIKPKKILEIGTAIGYSGAIMLLSYNKSHLTTLEKCEENYNMAITNFKKLNLTNRVNTILGDAKDILTSLIDKFDLIFLDGPKGQYINYLDILIKLLNKNGVLICDNVLFKGMVAGEMQTPANKRAIVKNLKTFNQKIAFNDNLNTTILNIGDGVSVSIKKES